MWQPLKLSTFFPCHLHFWSPCHYLMNMMYWKPHFPSPPLPTPHPQLPKPNLYSFLFSTFLPYSTSYFLKFESSFSVIHNRLPECHLISIIHPVDRTTSKFWCRNSTCHLPADTDKTLKHEFIQLWRQYSLSHKILQYCKYTWLSKMPAGVPSIMQSKILAAASRRWVGAKEG